MAEIRRAKQRGWNVISRFWVAVSRTCALPASTGLALLVGFAVAAIPSLAASFPPIPEAHKQLSEVAGSPDAEAVVLRAEAEFWMMDAQNRRPNSTIRVWRRIKVLTSEGADTFGEVRIPHSRQVRLSNFEARTVLPDGTPIEVPEDAVFRQASSRSQREFITAVTFPKVEPGVILDWSYDLAFDSLFYLEPWYFQDSIPVLYSEIVFHVPETIAVKEWGRSLPGKLIEREVASERDGRRLRVWLENLPAMPDEPFSPPESDLLARFMLVPTVISYPGQFGGQLVPLMETWKDTCKLFEETQYQPLQRKSGAVKKKARGLAKAAVAEGIRAVTPEARRAVAEAMYRFVRDDIRTRASLSIFSRDKITLDDVLETGEGTSVEKAILLQSLLAVASLNADLLWVPNRWEGSIDPAIPNPFWFEKAMVRAHLPAAGGTDLVLLDPSDRRLGFGFLHPTNEGVVALVFDEKDPKLIRVPLTPAHLSRRRAEVDLRLEAEGRLTGRGVLEMSGHHAWRHLSAGESTEAREESWQEWLDRRWPGFHITEIQSEENREGRSLQVTWKLEQREAEVLGDEASIQPSVPLGPVSQPFELEPEERKTPVWLTFGDTDLVETRITWPEGWELEAVPEAVAVANFAGVAQTQVEVDEAARALTYLRNMTLTRRDFSNSEEYSALRTIFETMETSDAQSLVWVAE